MLLSTTPAANAHTERLLIRARPPSPTGVSLSPPPSKVRSPSLMSGLNDCHPPPVTSAAVSTIAASSGRSPQSSVSTTQPTPTSTPAPGPPPSSSSSGPPSVGAASLVTVLGGGPAGMPVPGPLTPSASAALHHPLLGYVPHGNKILSRNLNGTFAVTSHPTNESELQLYRVLQRANLLNYYDTFISQGGDDVQQLCEAGEEEFLEIMALVGMASKPLHVRRLQKALQEWVSNPSMFQIPLLPNLPPSVAASLPSFGAARALMGATPTRPSPPNNNSGSATSSGQVNNTSPGLNKETNGNGLGPSPSSGRGDSITRDSGASLSGGSRGPSPAGLAPPNSYLTSPVHPLSIPQQNCQGSMGSAEKSPEFFVQFMKSSAESSSSGLQGSPPYPPAPNSPNQLNPTLHEAQIARLAQAAFELVANLPPFEPKKDALNNKRKISKELEYILNMNEEDPRRMDEIRKYAAIYGRFDCKRKPEKPLTLHEVSVNEAAAQICKYMPALLTRRDELFPLARQVVRDSGYQYSKGHSRSQTVVGHMEEPKHKRSRSDSGQDHHDYKNDLSWKKRQERLEAISDELRAMSERAEEVQHSLQSGSGNLAELSSQMDALQNRHAQLTLEQNELMKMHSRNRAKIDERNDDSDSQFSLSGANSPSQDTLLDEGLRVVKESLVHQREGPFMYPPSSRSDGARSSAQDMTTGTKMSSSPPASSSASMHGRMVSPPSSYSDMFSFAENKVISSCQGNIIAVANPALSLSSALSSAHHHLQEDDRHINSLYSLNHSIQKINNAIKQEPGSPTAAKQD